MTENPTPDPGLRAVDDQICFAVYSAGLAFGRAYHALLKDLDLTYPQYMALTALWHEDGQTVGALGRRLRLESNTLTPLLKRLESLGYVARQRGEEDERKVFVWLTGEGDALRAHAPGITRFVDSATGLEPELLRSLVETLGRVRDNVSAQATAPRGP